MRNISELCAAATDKERFVSIRDYVDFSRGLLDFLADADNYEARITSRWESHYKFYRYKEDAHYNVTRPVNERLFLSADCADRAFSFFQSVLQDAERMQTINAEEGRWLNAAIYTLQQSIGCALDALPASKNNTAKKINGDLTSGKDRLDKVFLDKLFYNRLKGVEIPHFAVFLGDVQRSGKEPHYGVSQTFLSGHFKAYTLLMNPLD